MCTLYSRLQRFWPKKIEKHTLKMCLGIQFCIYHWVRSLEFFILMSLSLDPSRTVQTFSLHRREIFVRGQSYFSRLPKYWPPIPLSARLCCGGRTDSPGGEGDGRSIFWKTREIGLPSYNDLSTVYMSTACSHFCILIVIIKISKQTVMLTKMSWLVPENLIEVEVF
jgi:hypothetical protein